MSSGFVLLLPLPLTNAFSKDQLLVDRPLQPLLHFSDNGRPSRQHVGRQNACDARFGINPVFRPSSAWASNPSSALRFFVRLSVDVERDVPAHPTDPVYLPHPPFCPSRRKTATAVDQSTSPFPRSTLSKLRMPSFPSLSNAPGGRVPLKMDSIDELERMGEGAPVVCA